MEKYKIEEISDSEEVGYVEITCCIQVWYGLTLGDEPGCKTKSESLELASVICSLLNSKDETPGL